MPTPARPDELVHAATRVARDRRARLEHLYAMTREERLAAFHRGELSFEQCLAWAARHPNEPPTGPCGEYLFILTETPEWLSEA
jgi:hypothetical protein